MSSCVSSFSLKMKRINDPVHRRGKHRKYRKGHPCRHQKRRKPLYERFSGFFFRHIRSPLFDTRRSHYKYPSIVYHDKALKSMILTSPTITGFHLNDKAPGISPRSFDFVIIHHGSVRVLQVRCTGSFSREREHLRNSLRPAGAASRSSW